MQPALSQAVALLALGAIGMTALSLTTAGQRMSAETAHLRGGHLTRPSAAAPVHLRADVAEGNPGFVLAAPVAPTASAQGARPGARSHSPVRHSPAHPRQKPAKWLPTGTG
ncbi:MAG: hypothetical protein JO074_09255, partial [Frankiales bacterium]|nr:hypothetical protein [Frankiales bacterium]